MPNSHSPLYDVVIAGAGPVGLLLAAELGLAGCSVLILERAAEPESRLKRLPFGLRGLSAATMESLDRRGLLDALRPRAVGADAPAAAHWMRQRRQPGGHFAGIQFFRDQIDEENWPWRLSAPEGMLAADMASIEAVLAARAVELGATILRDCGVESFDQSADDVSVRAGGARFRGRWLVGCDGARSAVRKAADIAFAGTEPEFTGYSMLAELADPASLPEGRHRTTCGMYTYAAPGTIALVDFDGGAFHRTGPVSRDHAEAVLRKVTGLDVAVAGLEQATTWTDRACQATAYRRGRVLLAGDAAHIHSPLGGQGLNLGLGDAMNLGWKLAAVIRGAAPELLDSYMIERHPVGAQVLDWSRAQVAMMRPGPGPRALEAVMRGLIRTGDGAAFMAERIWGTGLRYDFQSAHPLVGRSAPDFVFADGMRLNGHLRNGRGLLVDFDGPASLRVLAEKWRGRVDHISAEVENRLGLRASLIRPDGFVAWACDDDRDEEPLAPSLRRWFGA